MKKINKNVFKRTEFTLLVIVVLLFAIFSFSTDTFLTEYNLTNVLKQCSIIGIIAVAATFIIITGGIDLSCGAIVGMSSLVTALLLTRTNVPAFLIILIACAVGVVIGLYNAILINELNVPAFIATLGTMTIVRGLIKVIGRAKTIAGLPDGFSKFATLKFLGIPNLTWIWIAVLLISWFILKKTCFGRNIYVYGSGVEVAKLSGINIRKTVYLVYGCAGLLCGIAGVLLTSRVKSSVPTAGTGYEMSAIAATVIGGASLSGGKGTVIGTMIGTILMTLIDNGGIQLGIDPFIMEISTGVLITLAVVFDVLRNKKA